ncbi:MAG: hypothetical protein ACXAEI_18495 [Candidatus Hodarchaeales archaeon]|jgi:hypothetical protein
MSDNNDRPWVADEALPTVSYGWLKMPNNQIVYPTTVSQAEHASSVTYGTWSFDWAVAPGDDHQSVDIVSFMVNGYASNRLEPLPHSLNVTGYYLHLLSGDRTGWVSDPDRPSITLTSYNGSAGGSYKFPSLITGSHQIDITRSSLGEFRVYFDGTLIIGAVDNSITTSEKFILTSWVGDSAFDNIIVSSSIKTITPLSDDMKTRSSTGFLPLSIVFSFGIILINNQRKRGK